MRYDRPSPLSAGPALAAVEGLTSSSNDLLSRLLDGNSRFAEDRRECTAVSASHLEVVKGQRPFAIVLSCSDARVPMETVFDQMPGAIFSIRVAGNFVDDAGIGSIEFAIAALKASLILILGHTECGAVTAALGYVKDGVAQPGSIQALVEAVAPAVKAVESQGGDWLRNAIARNVKDNIAALRERSLIVSSGVNDGTIAIAGGVYDLDSGRVSLVP
jgi:carbonic anhydrase